MSLFPTNKMPVSKNLWLRIQDKNVHLKRNHLNYQGHFNTRIVLNTYHFSVASEHVFGTKKNSPIDKVGD